MKGVWILAALLLGGSGILGSGLHVEAQDVGRMQSAFIQQGVGKWDSVPSVQDQAAGTIQSALVLGKAPRTRARGMDNVHVPLSSTTTNSSTENDAVQTVLEVENPVFETPMGFSIGEEGQWMFPVSWHGAGEGPEVLMSAEGNAHGDYDVVVKVTNGGVLGEARAAVSVDGGASWIGETVLKEDVSIRGLGVELHFEAAEDSDELVEGDSYRFETVEAFGCISDHPEAARMAVYGHPSGKARPVVTILSSGRRGESKFSLALQEGLEPVVVEVVPEDGVFQYGELMYYFSDSEFQKGFTFRATVVPNEEKVKAGPFIIIGVMLFGAVAGGFMLLWARRERDEVYVVKR